MNIRSLKTGKREKIERTIDKLLITFYLRN